MNKQHEKRAYGHTFYSDVIGSLTSQRILDRLDGIISEGMSVEDSGSRYGAKFFRIDIVVTEL